MGDRFQVLLPQWRDVIEILIVAYVIYRALLLLVGTRALHILLGLVLLGATYLLAVLLKFTMISYLLGLLFSNAALVLLLALLIVFQPELRAWLARLGQSRVMRFFYRGAAREVAEEIAEAADRLSRAPSSRWKERWGWRTTWPAARRCPRRCRRTSSPRSSRRTRPCTTAP